MAFFLFFKSKSVSESKSEQTADIYLTQQFSGNCQISCQNVMNNVSVSIIDSTIGGNVEITQTCATKGTCLIDSNMDATSDIMFKAANSSNAKNAAASWLTPPNDDYSYSSSRQDIKTTINQTVSETCEISSYNQMNNISIFAANSTIGGSISIAQNASTQGQCMLSHSMKAAVYASGLAQNQAQSGKDKKGEKGGIVYLIIAIVVIVIAIIIGKIISGQSEKSATSKQEREVIEARALAGCPGRMRPILNPKTGKPIIDPKTNRPICPPPPMIPPSQQVPMAVSSSPQGPSQTIVDAPVTVVIQDPGTRSGSDRGGSRTFSSASRPASVTGVLNAEKPTYNTSIGGRSENRPFSI